MSEIGEQKQNLSLLEPEPCFEHLTPKQLARVRRLAERNFYTPPLFMRAMLKMYDQVVAERDTLQLHLKARNILQTNK